jgi:DNA-directed RNA polymerase II subunit RPB2
VLVRITYTQKRADGQLEERQQELTVPDVRLFRIPIMLHSRYCLLHDKPKQFLEQAGECPHDHGGYFVVDGSEKVLISRQEKAFNTLYIAKKPADPLVHTYATLSSLSPETRAVKYFAIALMRETAKRQPVINVSLPFIRKPINVFILFRVMGVQSDEDIVRLIFPDLEGAESRFLADKLIPTIVDAHPILNHFTALQFVKSFTKGFSEAHIIDIIKNQLFVHIPDMPGARVNYLAECVRSVLRVAYDFDKPTDRDDIRNQRCLTSGFLIQMLFNGIFNSRIRSRFIQCLPCNRIC